MNYNAKFQKLIADKCNGSIYHIDLINADKTCNVNGNDKPWFYISLVAALSALGILNSGMKMRNVNATIIRQSLTQYGIYINQRTNYDTYIAVCCILGDLGFPVSNDRIARFVKPNDRILLERYNEPKLVCKCGHPCCEYNYPKN